MNATRLGIGIGLALAATLAACDGGLTLSGNGDDAEAGRADDGATDRTDGGGDTAHDATDILPDTAEGCPAAEPSTGEHCGPDGLECDYGTETCCGETHPSYVCLCSGESFGCYATDACLGAPFGCSCATDDDCTGGYGIAWCEGGTCVPCDNSGATCGIYCPDGFVPPRNGCQPCACATTACETVGDAYCTCDVACGTAGDVCEAGLGRCVQDICALIDCALPCDPLRGCVPPECAVDADCKLLYSSCSCQAVPVTDPRTYLDACLFDGGAVCAYNNCTGDGVFAACRDHLCTEAYPPGCGG